MWQVIKLTLPSQILGLSMIFLFAAWKFFPFYPHDFDNLPFTLFLIVLYHYNVSAKSAKTWFHFKSLPLTFAEQAIIRVVLPLCLGLLIRGLMNSSHWYSINSESLWEDILLVIVVVLTSISADSFRSSVLHLLGWYLLGNAVAGLFPGAVIFSIAGGLAFSLYYLSDKRLNPQRVSVVATIGAIVTTIILALSFGLPRSEKYRCLKNGNCFESKWEYKDSTQEETEGSL